MLHSLSLHAPRAVGERLASGWRGTELRAGAGEAAGLGSLREMRAVSSVPATPDGACLDWAGWSCTGMTDERQTPSRLCHGKMIGKFQA